MTAHRTLRTRLSAAALAAALGVGGAAGALAAAAAPATAGGAAPAAALGPEQLVAASSQRMLTELSAHRSMYAKDPAKLDHLVATVLLPNFDTQYAAHEKRYPPYFDRP